jgi:hypothetical protein
VYYAFEVYDLLDGLIREYVLGVNKEWDGDFKAKGWTDEEFLDLLQNGTSYRQSDGTLVTVSGKFKDGGTVNIVQWTSDGIAQTYRNVGGRRAQEIFDSNGWTFLRRET